MIHSQDTHIYIIKPVGSDGPYKIGWSRAPINRLESLMVWSPFPLEIVATVPGGYALEQNIHSCLARSASHYEWFHATEEVKAFVNRVAAGVPIEQAIDLTQKHKDQSLAAAKRSRSWTPAHRVYMGNIHRVRHAENRASKQMGVKYDAPAEVNSAIDAMRPPSKESIYPEYRNHVPDYYGQPIIDQFVSDPVKYGVKRRPSDKRESMAQ